MMIQLEVEQGGVKNDDSAKTRPESFWSQTFNHQMRGTPFLILLSGDYNDSTQLYSN